MPARAHLAFPCFDQPDLKARWTLSLDVPEGWEALANGAETTRGVKDGQHALTFRGNAAAVHLPLRVRRRPVLRRDRATKRPHLPHAASRDRRGEGRAQSRRDVRSARRRRSHGSSATPASRIRSASSTSCWCRRSSSAAWSTPGAIFYNAAGLLLDRSATQNQKLGRASVIAHETAHMWFGDLVTMRWFNDVWMKEVFANFMAAKIVNPSFPEINHDLRFLLAHYPAAYDVDRTAGHQRHPPAARQSQRSGHRSMARSSIRRRRSSCASSRRSSARTRSATACASTCARTVRQRDVAGSDRAARRADARGSRGVEPRLGRRARTADRSRPSSRSRTAASPACRFVQTRSRSRGAAWSGISAAGRASATLTRIRLHPDPHRRRSRRCHRSAWIAGAALRPADRRRHRLRRIRSSTATACAIC